ncbi:hypothetical protein ONA91_14730 [Micromonospora sp. DR5-3]|uniref:hypothetical protein n=1 Tax=unclassified Micromonospora TaxID=2617518 RepID=UPI0011D84D35|nr:MULTISPECIES: hypothetical protein [unclassified Micromonospora]MCW3815709.1 hypothetical protein [Micromonospora sp. DR5-3]TYC23863.1 hypothetical protein FXF52_13750 [Micromonospora sp. MP36]
MAARFAVRPAGDCPAASSARPHAPMVDGDAAYLLSYGTPDHGVSVAVARCRACGVALLSVAPYGTGQASTYLELPDATLRED